MKFCHSCGHQNDESAIYCENCGADLDAENNTRDNSASTEQTIIEKEKTNKTNIHVTKTQTIIFAIIVIILLVLFGGYKIGENYYSFDNQVERYLTTLNSGDASQIADIIKTDDLNFEINEETIKPFADYVSEHPEYINELSSELINSYSESDSPLSLRLDGKNLFFFDNYSLYMSPIYTDVSTNMEGAVISMDGVEIATADSDEFNKTVGPFALGEYTFNSTFASENSELVNESTVDFIQDYDYTSSVDLALNAVNIGVNANVDQATVYLNGAAVGELADGYAEIGPLAYQEDSTLYIGKEYPSGELISDEQVMDYYDSDYYFDLMIATDYNAEYLLDEVYMNAERIINNSSYNAESNLAERLVGGESNDLYNIYVNTAQNYAEDADFSSLDYTPQLISFEQTDTYTYNIEYDLEVEENYNESDDSSYTIKFEGTATVDEEAEALLLDSVTQVKE